MTITHLSDLTGVSKHTLRYYERLGLVPLVSRDRSSGHRRYTPGHAEWIRFLRQLRETGMPLRDMRTYARLVTRGDSTWAERKQMLAEHRARGDAEIALLRSPSPAAQQEARARLRPCRAGAKRSVELAFYEFETPEGYRALMY